MENLCLGVAREIITPEIGGRLYGYGPDVYSESIADDLTVTAFYFKQGETKALMLSATVCLIKTELSQNILSLLEEKFNIPKQNCILSATHTHSGPNMAGVEGWGDIDKKYCDEIFIPGVLSATEKAIKNAKAVKMGVAAGDSLVGVNRRELNDKNSIVLGQNTWGSFNPEMTVISFTDLQNKPIANIIHYGAHGTASGRNHEITRDWSGVMTDALEKHSGAVTAFFNGPEGDVGPRLSNGKTVGNLNYMRELGELAAEDATRIFDKMSGCNSVNISVSNKNLVIPLKERISLEKAEKMLAEYKNQTENCGAMMKSHFEEVIESYKSGFVDKPSVEVEQTLIVLGDIVFASFPYELFSEIGMRINGLVKTKTVLSLSNSNGSEGYYITRDVACRGGYEVNMFLYSHIQQFDDDADFYIMKESVNHIKNLINEE